MFKRRTEEIMRLACFTNKEQDDPSDCTIMELCPMTGKFLKVPCEENASNQEQDLSDSTGMELCPMTGNFLKVQCEENKEVDVGMISDGDHEVSVTEKIKIHQKRRANGKTYLGYEKLNGVYKQSSVKGQKKMKERCDHKLSKKINPNSLNCYALNEDDRSLAFNKFWSFTWPEKKAYIHGLATTRQIKKRRSNTSLSSTKKNNGHDFYLPTHDGKRYKVCLKMFINTLSITQSMLNRWCTSQSTEAPSIHLERICHKKTKISISNKNNVKKWLDLLPKVPSHYCRQNSKRIYVDTSFLSKTHMLGVFNSWCEELNLPKVGRNVFNNVLKQENISIHHPRKDQCDLCISYKHGNIDKDVFDRHIKRKEQAKEAKAQAKNSASDTTLVLTMDLQSVLLCPKLMASAVYYRQKLQVHNFTIYELNNANVTLYTWHEADGGVTANEFTSCIISFLKNLPQSYTKVVLISDGCNYQNRNKVLASALSDHAKDRGIILEQIILEKGHTMMEADNVHSVLEHYFKAPIYAPSDYVSRMKMARPKQPYVVHNLHYDFFSKYEDPKTNLPSLRPGKKMGDPTVTDLRAVQYLPTGEIKFKIDHAEEWKNLPHRRKNISTEPPRLYSNPIPLTESKYKHLQELKSVIDKDYHPFYDNLSFK